MQIDLLQTFHTLSHFAHYMCLFLTLNFELCSSPLLLRLYKQPLTNQTQPDVAPTCCYKSFPGNWQFFLEGCRASHSGLKYSLSLTVCLNHTLIYKYLINTELYLNFSKYIDELLVVKSLINILKFTYFSIHFLQYPF